MDTVQIMSLVVSAASCAAAIVATVVAFTAYRRQTSPDVIVYVGTSNGVNLMRLFVVNIGNAPAWDVRIELDGEIPITENAREVLTAGFMKDGIPFLPPGGSREIPLGVSFHVLEEMKEADIHAVVVFHRKGNRPRSSIRASFPIEGNSYFGTTITLPPLKRELDKIAREVGVVSENLRSIAK